MKILVIGNCGSGKTWVMQQLISRFAINKFGKIGKFYFNYADGIVVIGKYDNTIFQGSDRLSMAVMSDIDMFNKFAENKLVICEGDRLTNSTFITKSNPTIIRITDDGLNGRKIRNSNQTERHLKSIATRVNNITPHYQVSDSNECLNLVIKLINNEYGNRS